MKQALLPALLAAAVTIAANSSPAVRRAHVDDAGVLRWRDTGDEIALFGLNYYVPFSIDYHELDQRGLDHKQAIREDVTHFHRLGLTAIRLHCFDREISDPQGNLLDNHHMDLLDYLISECKQRGIYSVMTPIAWWGAPSGDGFSNYYSKQQITTDPHAWQIQCNYLRQFLDHVNRYTGEAYKDDPAIVAFEIINEPQYPPGTTDEQITEYINTLTRAMRDTGCAKPIFYSYFEGRLEANAAAITDGVTFGWYPTGLVAGHMLQGNHLPKVDDYPMMRRECLNDKAKIVYEFDAADVHGSYMYPAMARAFCSGGAQIATQFQYEPMCIAADNVNWQTHYLNLAYTPHKAISFAIAAEAFRRIPRLEKFGSYPESATFADVRVSCDEDLSELVTAQTFMHSNDTDTRSPSPEKLTRIWGCGSSPMLEYSGTGAYFLDRTGPNQWRLQVYPDAVVIADPYTGGTNEKVRTLWAEHDMTIHLPQLGDRFTARPLRPEADTIPAREGTIHIRPGEYILGPEAADPSQADIPQFIAPPASERPPAATARAPSRWLEGKPYAVQASVAATDVKSCTLNFRSGSDTDYRQIPMERTTAYQYRAEVPPELIKPGTGRYYLLVQTSDATYAFPGGRRNPPTQPETHPPAELLSIAPSDQPPDVNYYGPEDRSSSASIVDGPQAKDRAIRIEADAFGPPPSCAAVEWPIDQLPDDLSPYNAVRFTARGGPYTSLAEISLVEDDGDGYGYNVPLTGQWQSFTVPLRKLRKMWSTEAPGPQLQSLDHVTIVFGSWLFEHLADKNHWVEVASVQLIQTPDVWQVEIAAQTDPIILVRAADHHPRLHGADASWQRVPGMDRNRFAVRVATTGFDEEPSSTSFRLRVGNLDPWRRQMANADQVIIKARAAHPATHRLELVLLERDGSPWGTMQVPLTQQWRAIKIPISEFRFFDHWNVAVQSRGGEDDRLHTENIDAVNICFGAWLYGDDRDKPHAIEVQEISLRDTEAQ